MQPVDRKKTSWKMNERVDDEKSNKKRKIRYGRMLLKETEHMSFVGCLSVEIWTKLRRKELRCC